MRACTVGRGFRSPKHKHELRKGHPSEESRSRSGFPQLESKPGEPVSLLSLSCAGWSSAPSSSHTPEPTVTQPLALEKLTCTFGTPMYFRKRCRSLVFLCTERWTGPPVHLSQLISSYQAGQQKARREFWHCYEAHGPTRQ